MIRILITIIFIFNFTSSYAEKDKFVSVMLAGSNFGKGLDSTLLPKLRAALNLSCDLTGKYKLLSDESVNETIKNFEESNRETTTLSIAKELKADRILFVNLGKIENIIKVEITSYLCQEEEEKMLGIGYAFLNFRNVDNNQALLDPSLLKATQMAFAEAVGESGIYTTLEGSFNVIPQIPVVITSLYFNEEEGKSPWKLFENKVVNSYDAVLKVFESAELARRHIVFDIDTRDTIYSFFRLYLIENYNKTSSEEIDALYKVGIDNIIAGEIKMDNSKASLRLDLVKILPQNKTEIINSETTYVENDDIGELRAKVAYLTKKLLEINQ